MTLLDQLQAVYADCGHGPTPGPAVQERIRRYLNEAVQIVLSEPGMDRLLDSDQPYPFTSVDGQARYAVPDVATIRHVFDQTHDRVLGVMSVWDYRRHAPDPSTSTGTPTHLVPIGRVAVATVPSVASELFIKSTSASDVGTAFLEGTITGGYPRTVSATMTGATAKSLNTAVTSFLDVTDLYLSAPAVGIVTLHQTSGVGTELARIAIGQTRTVYTGFYLYPTPSAAVSYFVDYRRGTTDMVQHTDEPPWPRDWHLLCPTYARWREWEHAGETDRILIAKQQWDRGLSRLKYAVRSMPADLPVAGRGRRIGHSRLGSWTPADSYTW